MNETDLLRKKIFGDSDEAPLDLAAIADHWEAIALSDERMAAWNREHGLDLSKAGQSPGDHRARSARAVAKALRLEIETGRAHCSICFGDHPNHLHTHFG